MKPHIHAAVIHAFADGADIQYLNDNVWFDVLDPTWAKATKYRVKPAAPKWPQTTMTETELERAANALAAEYPKHASFCWRVADAALQKACELGHIVPADKVRVIEAKARAEGKREGMNPVHVIEAAWRHMKLGRLDPETIQIILLQAAK